ncbi:sulfur carrier protein ThiS [Leifsonia sp. L25]|uniref:sulfur carrier protein ThiS n=1 Tax=Leifsonia sp. L25 TaxID=3423957 RepID=UPI003D6841E0
MITITVNGQPQEREVTLSVADLVEERTGIRVGAGGATSGAAPLGIAVAVNSAVIPRSGWAGEELADGDIIEIVSATQGG